MARGSCGGKKERDDMRRKKQISIFRLQQRVRDRTRGAAGPVWPLTSSCEQNQATNSQNSTAEEVLLLCRTGLTPSVGKYEMNSRHWNVSCESGIIYIKHMLPKSPHVNRWHMNCNFNMWWENVTCETGFVHMRLIQITRNFIVQISSSHISLRCATFSHVN